MDKETKAKLLMGKSETLVESSAGGRIKWESPGQIVEGELLSIVKYKKGIFGKESNIYTFDTVEGEKTFFLGQSTDRKFAHLLNCGEWYRITFKGQLELRGGHRMNDFRLDRLILSDTTERSTKHGEDVTPIKMQTRSREDVKKSGRDENLDSGDK